MIYRSIVISIHLNVFYITNSIVKCNICMSYASQSDITTGLVFITNLNKSLDEAERDESNAR